MTNSNARGSFNKPIMNNNARGSFNKPMMNNNAWGRQMFNGNSMERQQYGNPMGMSNMYNGDGMGQRMWQRGDDFMGQVWDDSMSGSWSNEDWSGEDWSDNNRMGMPRPVGNRMNLRQWDDKDSWFKEDDKDEDWSGDWSDEDWSDGNIWQNGGNRMGPRPGDFMRQLDDFGGKRWDDSMSDSWFKEDDKDSRFNDWSGSWSDEDLSDSSSSSSSSESDSSSEEFPWK